MEGDGRGGKLKSYHIYIYIEQKTSNVNNKRIKNIYFCKYEVYAEKQIILWPKCIGLRSSNASLFELSKEDKIATCFLFIGANYYSKTVKSVPSWSLRHLPGPKS